MSNSQFYPRYIQMMKLLARIDQYMVGEGFEEEELEYLRRATGLIGYLLLRQFRTERNRHGEIRTLLVAGLSEREAQICGMMLKGHSAKTISLDLDVADVHHHHVPETCLRQARYS